MSSCYYLRIAAQPKIELMVPSPLTLDRQLRRGLEGCQFLDCKPLRAQPQLELGSPQPLLVLPNACPVDVVDTCKMVRH
ncbi:hypothetical protein P153DRAFT_362162 [Dothidotthia symphoricarpi CBS 119687]|uniref:Uncharacterized protein n=1 Tax=Dothidotthia symphoricarpi CBS 119687 TaxID=1392245 RepID=A0A6A6ARF4_9PLEO|nr:uncharacterized protein P153DRAFT_362162 [Dothidotthia symphoricarpi CBS 119687]KAF2134390.1 hypothetical protein P153DRAFT_362162 [Dothidotthia symphoricarpi CBS 119687]